MLHVIRDVAPVALSLVAAAVFAVMFWAGGRVH
jgi:hypothetical protein